jgi:hypothetical protein
MKRSMTLVAGFVRIHQNCRIQYRPLHWVGREITLKSPSISDIFAYLSETSFQNVGWLSFEPRSRFVDRYFHNFWEAINLTSTQMMADNIVRKTGQVRSGRIPRRSDADHFGLISWNDLDKMDSWENGISRRSKGNWH